ncbi:PhlB family protein [Novosphingobium percolationis]|uniref:OB-fold domain-containing protein n=1 Tax=Novosphingobium percolationis TaxID=2871811 RepID=UPI001CD49DA6|nr:OB-fold domain-containing protein [Novosphingobium percolationis]
MFYAPETAPIDLPTFKSTIAMPYTLTPGRSAGTFLAEMPNRRIVGSRFAGGKVIAPAQDFSPVNGDEPEELVQVPENGELTAFTRVDGVVIGLVRLDGCENAFAHRILADLADCKVGQRVAAQWASEDAGTSITAIEGFVLSPDAPVGEVKPLVGPAEPLGVINYSMALDYDHAYGPYYGRMFDELKENGVVMGVRGSNADDALLPPREIDDITHKRTGTWKACADTGTIRACSLINMEVYGQTRPVPYAYAEIVLDGASTKMIHIIEIDDLESAKQTIKPGTRVRAIWTKGERKGAVSDIERFEVIEA